jgi:broad specificity phosphatase PhoE
MKNINIYLIRHGESAANANSPDQIGQDNDTELTDRGIAQAEALGRRFIAKDIRFYSIYSSTYLRAKQTAKIVKNVIGYPQPINYTDEIVEYNPGDLKGKTRSQIYTDIEKLNAINYQNMGYLFPNGESYHRVSRRAATFLEDSIIYNKSTLALAKDMEVNVGVFSHGMTIKAMLFYVMGFDQSFMWRVKIDNTSISHIVYNDKGFFLNSINDLGHLLS